MKAPEVGQAFKSGFISIVGRPNVGKSTLLNHLVQSKVAIISDKPQTTRNAIRGVVNAPDGQAVFIDTPGLHKPRNVLGEHLNIVVRRTLAEVDACLFMLDASASVGRGDTFIAHELSGIETPVICVLNKIDQLRPEQVLAQLEVARHLGRWVAIFAVSALQGTGLSALLNEVMNLLEPGPRYYPEGVVTDQPANHVVAEMVREKVLGLTREEVPHSVAVVVESIEARPVGELIDVCATVFVERDSQKGILIGKGGRMLKEIGIHAREEIERLLGSHVYLDLRVKVEKDWQRRSASLKRLGF